MLQSLSLPNGTQTNYGYDGLQRLTQMQTVAGSANISNYAYAYDNVTHRPGRQSEVSQIAAEDPITRAYGYDGVDQLTGETVTQSGQTVSQSTLGYDPMGNRTGAQSTSASSQSTSSYTSNKLNQLIALTTTTGTDTSQSTLGYDLSGNLTSVTSGTSGTSYSYDDAHRLSAVEVPGQSKSTFLYDGLSRLRVSRDFAWQNGAWVQTGEVRRVYDGMDVVQERDAQNNPVCTYTRAGNIGGILARSDANGHLYYHYDGRGNVSQLTDASAQVQARYSYDAWGSTSSSGAAAGVNRYRFSTKEQIGGLYSYGYRFYSPGLGRWINRDPIEEDGGLNVYAMVENDPGNLVDEHGLAPDGQYPGMGHGWTDGIGGAMWRSPKPKQDPRGYHFVFTCSGQREGLLRVYDYDDGSLVFSGPASNHTTNMDDGDRDEAGTNRPAPPGHYGPITNGNMNSDGRQVIKIHIPSRPLIYIHSMGPGVPFSWAETQGCIRVEEDDLDTLRDLVRGKGRNFITIR